MKHLLSLALLAACSALPVAAETASDSLGLRCATEVFSLPHRPFMHKIVASSPEAQLSVKGLPKGLRWNAQRRLIEGTAPAAGSYSYSLIVSSGKQQRTIPAQLTVSKSLGLARPFMGWISWNVVEGNISASVVRQVADAMTTQGLSAAGYRYLIIDDLWHAPQRAADGATQPDPKKFPEGMKPVVDYVHGRGLKFGIYSDAAERTCAGAYGSLGYEQQDARTYAQWGVDLLKYDYCFAPKDAATAEERYRTMGTALREAGGILLYMCEWGARKPWLWGARTGASAWRATYDTRDCWVGKPGGIGVTQSIEDMKGLWPYSGVNRFNDADMMCVGIHGTGKSSSDLCATGPGMTQDEYTTQFALWCMWSSPLLLSFDLTKPIRPEDKRLITNADLIALDQDELGQQAELVLEDQGIIYFMKDLANGDVAISATNLKDSEQTAHFDFTRFSALKPKTRYRVRDCVEQRSLPAVQGSLSTAVRPHATVVYRLSRQARR